jgi:hypothetical protein
MDNYREIFYREILLSGEVFDIALNEWATKNNIPMSDKVYVYLKSNERVRRTIAERAFKKRTRGLNVSPAYLKRQLSQSGSDTMLLKILKEIFASFTADASPAVKKKTVDEARVDPKRNLWLTDLLADLRELCV